MNSPFRFFVVLVLFLFLQPSSGHADVTLVFSDTVKQHVNPDTQTDLEALINTGLRRIGQTNEGAQDLLTSNQTIRVLCFGEEEANEYDELRKEGAELIPEPGKTLGDFEANGKPKKEGTARIAIDCDQLRRLGWNGARKFFGFTMWDVLIHELLHATNAARRHPPDELSIYVTWVRDFKEVVADERGTEEGGGEKRAGRPDKGKKGIKSEKTRGGQEKERRGADTPSTQNKSVGERPGIPGALGHSATTTDTAVYLTPQQRQALVLPSSIDPQQFTSTHKLTAPVVRRLPSDHTQFGDGSMLSFVGTEEEGQALCQHDSRLGFCDEDSCRKFQPKSLEDFSDQRESQSIAMQVEGLDIQIALKGVGPATAAEWGKGYPNVEDFLQGKKIPWRKKQRLEARMLTPDKGVSFRGGPESIIEVAVECEKTTVLPQLGPLFRNLHPKN